MSVICRIFVILNGNFIILINAGKRELFANSQLKISLQIIFNRDIVLKEKIILI